MNPLFQIKMANQTKEDTNFVPDPFEFDTNSPDIEQELENAVKLNDLKHLLNSKWAIFYY